MKNMKIAAWAVVLIVCSVAVVGIGHSITTSTYENTGNTSTVTQSSHTVGIWSGESGDYTLVSNGGLVNNITYEVNSHTTGSGTTYAAESQTYTIIENKYVFIDGNESQTTYNAGNVLLEISGFNPTYIDGSSITVKLNETTMNGEFFTVGENMSWIGLLTLGSTENSCKLTITMETFEKESYTYNGFGNLSISVKMACSSDVAYYSTSLNKSTSVTVPSGTNGKFIAGAIFVPSASNVTVTFGSALPNNAQVYIGGTEASTSDHTTFNCTSSNGGAIKIVFASATAAEATYTVSVTSS